MQQKIAYINLSTNKITTEIIPESIRRKFLGGRGINIYLLNQLVTPGLNPMSGDNPLIIGAGLLTGLNCPSPSRTSISGKSPETELLGDSNFGGHFGAGLRKTGFDHLVFLGKALSPVYVCISPTEIKIHQANDLWGMDTVQTQNCIKNEYGQGTQILCIGPSGENLVRFACVRHDLKSTAGRGGLGCLMGSKNLKAVVVIDVTKSREVYSKELSNYTKELNQRICATRTREVLHERGTLFLFDLHNFQGIVRVHNTKSNKFEFGKSIKSSVFRNFYHKKLACYNCKIACRHEYILKQDGQEHKAVGPEYGTLGAFGPICGIFNPDDILKINDYLNRLGLDSSSTGNIIAWTIQLFENEILKLDDTGIVLKWGDANAIIKLIHQIAKRQNFGNLLAKGAKEASRIIGKDSSKYLVWTKFLLQSDSVDVRVHKGFALGVATSTRGADHLRSRPTMEALSLTPEELKDFYGTEVDPAPNSYDGKARMVWQSEIEYSLGDALGICRFAQRFNNPNHLNILELKKLTELATNMIFSEQEFFDIGERILTLERHFLQKEGLSRKDDDLPEVYFKPMKKGSYKNESIDEDKFKKMLDEYYNWHGWNIYTGMPDQDILVKLGIDDVAEK